MKPLEPGCLAIAVPPAPQWAVGITVKVIRQCQKKAGSWHIESDHPLLVVVEVLSGASDVCVPGNTLMRIDDDGQPESESQSTKRPKETQV